MNTLYKRLAIVLFVSGFALTAQAESESTASEAAHTPQMQLVMQQRAAQEQRIAASKAQAETWRVQMEAIMKAQLASVEKQKADMARYFEQRKAAIKAESESRRAQIEAASKAQQQSVEKYRQQMTKFLEARYSQAKARADEEQKAIQSQLKQLKPQA